MHEDLKIDIKGGGVSQDDVIDGHCWSFLYIVGYFNSGDKYVYCSRKLMVIHEMIKMNSNSQ